MHSRNFEDYQFSIHRLEYDNQDHTISPKYDVEGNDLYVLEENILPCLDFNF